MAGRLNWTFAFLVWLSLVLTWQAFPCAQFRELDNTFRSILEKLSQGSDSDAAALVDADLDRYIRAQAKLANVSPNDLDDVVNETLTKLWLQRANYRSGTEAEARGYIAAVTKNLIVDRIRKERAARRGGDRRKVEPDEVERFVPAPEEDVLHQLDLGQQARLLNAAIEGAGLTTLQQSVMRLRSRDLTFAEIAEQLSENPSSVKSAAREGGKKVRGFMALDRETKARELFKWGKSPEEIAALLDWPIHRVIALLDRDENARQIESLHPGVQPEPRALVSQSQFEMAMRQAKNEEREIMRLHYIDRLPTDQVAQRLKVEEPWVKSRIPIVRAEIEYELGIKLKGQGNELRVVSDETYELHTGKSAKPTVVTPAVDRNDVGPSFPYKKEGVLHLSVAQFEDAIAKIPFDDERIGENHRDILRRYYLSGQTPKEIGEPDGRSQESISQSIRQDLKKLRKILSDPDLVRMEHLSVFNERAQKALHRKKELRNRLIGDGPEQVKRQYQLTPAELKSLIDAEFPESNYRRELLTRVLLGGESLRVIAQDLGFHYVAVKLSARKALQQLGQNQLGLNNLHREQIDLVDSIEETIPTVHTPHQFYSVSEEDFDRAISNLSNPKIRRILRLRLVDSYTTGDIALITGEKPQDVSTALKKGFDELAVVLERPGLSRSDFGVRPAPKQSN